MRSLCTGIVAALVLAASASEAARDRDHALYLAQRYAYVGDLVRAAALVPSGARPPCQIPP